MRNLMIGAGLVVLAGALAASCPAQGRDERHGNGRHGGEDRRRDVGDDEHHDNGNHNGWYKHGDRDDHRDWDDDHDRFRPGHPYPHGRYEYVRRSFIATSIDYRTRRVMLFDHSNWVVASYDLDRCRDWRWDRDSVFVYDDDRHPGWYLLFNARLGRYVHVEYFGR